MRQHNGFVSVESEPGVGTTFTLLFPRPLEPLEVHQSDTPRIAPTSRGECVLLVEDEEALRKMTERVLSSLGYRVLSFPHAGLVLSSVDPAQIDLLLTDVVLPGMNGRELADRLRAVRPGIKTLFVSGYTDQMLGERGVLEARTHLILKPYRPDELATKIRQVLDET
jgi:CheY-like chemotaxis protein